MQVVCQGAAEAGEMRLKKGRGRGGVLTPMKIIGRLPCLLGFHDFRVLEVTFGFGAGGNVERIQCKRCGLITTRHG